MEGVTFADSRERQRSASLLDIPHPVCCQNCLAIGKASAEKSTICNSMDSDDLELCEEFLLSSDRIMNWFNLTGEAVLAIIKERHCSAIFFDGQSKHFSPLTPNFCSQIPASYNQMMR